MNKNNIKRAIVALALCTAGEGTAYGVGGVVGGGITIYTVARNGQAEIDQSAAANTGNGSAVTAVQTNTVGNVSGATPGQVKNASAPQGL